MAQPRSGTRESNDMPSVRSWFVMVGTTSLLVAIFAAGKLTRDAVRNWDRYTVAFADIDCTPPPGQDCLDFLAEVQYLAGMPDRLSILDEDLAAHLADAFARHPLVERVRKIAVRPARQVQVRLDFRAQSKSGEFVRW
jgi:hypothetical protein